MGFLFLGMALFFAVRAFLYFRSGRMIAAVLAGLACCLFLGGLYVDFAKKTAPTQAVEAR